MELRRPIEFTAEFCEGLVASLDRCYKRVGRMYRPSIGLDERWAGITISMLVGREYAKEFQASTETGLRTAGPVYEIVKGPHVFRTNKLGRTSDTNIESAFPRPSRAVAEMASVNALQATLGLEGVDQAIEPSFLVELPAPTRWIVGHMGTAEQGLRAVYLCAPWTSFENAVTAWRGWIPILVRDAAASGSTDAPGLPEEALPLALGIELPPLQLLDEEAGAKERDVG